MSYDFIDAVGKSYSFVWEKRETIGRLALGAFVIKVIMMALIFAVGLEQNLLRQGLFILPADFIEGLFIAFVIRMALFNENLRFGDLRGDFMDSDLKKTVLSGAALYVLIKLISVAVAGFIWDSGMLDQETGAVIAPSGDEENLLSEFVNFTAAFFIFVFIFWAFRLLFIYVPIVLGWGVQEYMLRVRGYGISFVLIATWLLCFIPLAMLIIGASEILSGIFPQPEDAQGLSVYRFAMILVQVMAELISGALIAVAIAFGLQEISEKDKA